MKKLLSRSLLLFPFICSVTWAENESDLQVHYRYDNSEFHLVGVHTEAGYIFGDISNSKSVTISTLDWQPYIGEHMCRQGWVQQLTVALLNSQGYTVISQFRPWARAVLEVESGETNILYPEYRIGDHAPSDVYPDTLRLDHLALSESFPGGIVALIKRKEYKLSYDGDLNSLRNKVIGVVRGYENTPEFDDMMDQGVFTIVEAIDDLQLANMLLAKRVDLIVGDPKVIFYRLGQTQLPGESNAISQLEVLEPPLAYNELFYAVSKKRRNWQTLLADINMALQRFKGSGELQRLINSTLRQCGYFSSSDR